MKSELSKNITVVARGAGERTEKLCLELLTQQIDEENVHLISAAPFAVAHKNSLELGVKEGRKWTMIIDADVLVASNVIERFYKKAESMPKSVFELHSQMLDRFFGGVRYGGIKMYRTSMLNEAIGHVPEAGSQFRPETHMLKQMHKRKHWWILTDIVAGIHDFEQYYKDIFRKGYTHGVKFDDFTKTLMPYWQRMAEKDKDFEILLKGFDVGQNGEVNELMLDKDEVKDEFEETMEQMGMDEKKAETLKSYTSEDVDDIITNLEEANEFQTIKRQMNANMPYQPNIFFEKIKEKLRLS